eukprot:m.21282 g.21282  ORF g.21282 m.21282 type:complete len:588 (-) comp13327_c0_seq1:213-1976(-)
MSHSFTYTVLVLSTLVIMNSANAPKRVGDAWGTNIHWTKESVEGEAAMLSKAYKVARMDFHWASIESECGKYNFSAYDGLLAIMKAAGVRPYWILDYGNPCYPPRPIIPVDCKTETACRGTCQEYFGTCSDGTYYCCARTPNNPSGCDGVHKCPTNPNLVNCACNAKNSSSDQIQDHSLSQKQTQTHRVKKFTSNNACNTVECIQAFGNFAKAAVAHFRGNNIIFECLNEPNGMGGDNATDITKVCLAAGTAFTNANELFVGPATSGFDWPYLNTSMKDGILNAFGAVSVHPYRAQAPETVLADYSRLRDLIQTYGTTPAMKAMPVLSGEWGYTTAKLPCIYNNRVDEFTQAAYLTRMWLINALAGIEVSINYDWVDDGNDATSCEANFGSVNSAPTGNENQPFKPKPSYDAAMILQTTLGDFNTVLPRVAVKSVMPTTVPPANVFVLPFHNTANDATGYAAWSNGTVVPLQCGNATVPQRRDCGHLYISKADCVSPTNPKGPGCCWEANEPHVGGPQCYKAEKQLAISVSISFTVAKPSACWMLSDMLNVGEAKQVCSDANAVLNIDIDVLPNGTTTTPVYLIPLL